MRKQVFIVLAFVLLTRLPFLDQAIQGDDFYYLAAAEHAQIDAAHPHHAKYVFLGVPMDMRGHPHPPGNAWLLAGLLAAAGDVREVPFHLAYLGLSWIAALSMLALARRFAPERALEATLLFCAVPAFLVNANSLESDLPLLAFWMLSCALALAGRTVLAAAALAACSMMAYQTVVLIPILGWWYYRRGELRRNGWVLAVPVVVIGGWSLFERMTSGSLPAQVLNEHFQNYGLQRMEAKLRSAVALCGHLAVMCSPLGLYALARRRHWFLTAWVAIFFCAALALFFAGSARYLLPLAAPLALIVTLEFAARPRLLWAAIALQTALGLALAWANYDHWDGYRRFSAEAMRAAAGKRVWVNGEWGLRYYTEAEGALPMVRGQVLRPGDYVISSALAERIPYTTGGGVAVEQMRREITPRVPLRLIGLGSRSGYSSVGFGLWPFDVSNGPADVVTLSALVERAPSLEFLPMTSRDVEWQIISGVYTLENAQWRWMGPRAVFVLKSPGEARAIEASIYIPDPAPGRTVTIHVDGREVARETYAAPGAYKLVTAPLRPSGGVATVTLEIDKEFKAAGDDRRLGMILSSIGFVQPPPPAAGTR